VDQFMRLREVIEERVSRKFFEEEFQVDPRWCCGLMISHDSRFYDSHHSPALRGGCCGENAARWNSSRAPERPRRRMRSEPW